MKKYILLFLLAAIGGYPLAAQEQTFSLQELYSLADRNNKSLRVSTSAVDAARQEAALAKSQRLPQINTELSVNYNGRGLLTDRDFSHLMNIYIPEYGNNFSLQVSQVIYAGGAINQAVELSKMGVQMATLDLQKNRQEVRFVIAGNYLDLYRSLNTLEVLEQHINLARLVLQNMHSRYEQGTALANDITRFELQLQNLQLQHARVQDGCRILNHSLCLSTGLPEGTLIRPDSTLLVQGADAIEETLWQQQVTQSNTGLQQAALAVQISDKQVTMAKSASLPQVAVIAQENLTGPVTIEVPALDKNFNYWYVGLGVQYDVSSLFKNRHKVHQARVEAQKANEAYDLAVEQVSQGVQAACIQYQTAFTTLATQEKNVQLATENYKVVTHRYDNGLALLTDLLDASAAKLSADLQYVEARINLTFLYYQLLYLAHRL